MSVRCGCQMMSVGDTSKLNPLKAPPLASHSSLLAPLRSASVMNEASILRLIPSLTLTISVCGRPSVFQVATWLPSAPGTSHLTLCPLITDRCSLSLTVHLSPSRLLTQGSWRWLKSIRMPSTSSAPPFLIPITIEVRPFPSSCHRGRIGVSSSSCSADRI